VSGTLVTTCFNCGIDWKCKRCKAEALNNELAQALGIAKEVISNFPQDSITRGALDAINAALAKVPK
jgi:hypothetical protein